MKGIHAFEPIWENWVIDEEIGRGSFGTVWKAHREDQFSHVKQYAAVKHISIPKQENQGENDIPFPSEVARSQYYRNMLDRLIVEIDAMISLRGKPNIVAYEEHKVVPKENDSGYDLFLRMELLRSISSYCPFAGYIHHPLSRGKVIQLGIDIATALETLENRNMIHRDIKPDNIFVDEEGNFKLGDFGTARVLEVTENASTKTGTPNYMAPEVYTKLARYDQTVDIYSLGIMLYRYMNDGFLPFMSETALEGDVALARRMHGEPIPPPRNADRELAGIILKACAYRPEDRYQNAGDLKRDLLKCKEQNYKEVDVPIICVMDDGRIIFRSHKKAESDSQIKITINDFPYRKFVGEDKELISAREIVVTIDENGRTYPQEAVFTLRENKKVFAVSVQVICLDENNHELLVQRANCVYQSRNVVKAPVIPGYKPVGQTEVEVEVQQNQTTRPPQVFFRYEKEKAELWSSEFDDSAEREIPVLCVSENGQEILSSKRTFRENTENIVNAPEITGYALIGDNNRRVRVSHNGYVEPDKVIFTYRKIRAERPEKRETTIPLLCRDDQGNELKRGSAVVRAGQPLKVTAPELNGYKLINESNRTVELTVDSRGVPSQSEVLFLYKKEEEREKKKEKEQENGKEGEKRKQEKNGQNKKRTPMIAAILAIALILGGVAIWLLNLPDQKDTEEQWAPITLNTEDRQFSVNYGESVMFGGTAEKGQTVELKVQSPGSQEAVTVDTATANANDGSWTMIFNTGNLDVAVNTSELFTANVMYNDGENHPASSSTMSIIVSRELERLTIGYDGSEKKEEASAELSSPNVTPETTDAEKKEKESSSPNVTPEATDAEKKEKESSSPNVTPAATDAEKKEKESSSPNVRPKATDVEKKEKESTSPNVTPEATDAKETETYVYYDEEADPIIMTTDVITEDTWVISGIAEPGSKVEILVDGERISDQKYDQYTVFTARRPQLTEGSTVRVIATDRAQNRAEQILTVQKAPASGTQKLDAYAMGKVFTTAHTFKEDPRWLMAGYYTAEELENGVEVPLVAANAFHIGSVSQKIENGQFSANYAVADGVELSDIKLTVLPTRDKSFYTHYFMDGYFEDVEDTHTAYWVSLYARAEIPMELIQQSFQLDEEQAETRKLYFNRQRINALDTMK